MKKASIVTLMFFLSLAIIGVAIGARTSKTSASEIGDYSSFYTEDVLPPEGAWSLICAPSLANDKGPASVYAVTSVKGDRITKISIRSRSTTPVIAVKLGWRLFYYKSPEQTLMSGESPLLGVPLNEKERRDIEFPLVSFARVSKSLMQNGRVDGDFKIEVSVTDILFDEEKTSMLSRGFSSLTSFLPGGNSKKEAMVKVTNYPSTIALLDGCQDQECKFEANCYTCKTLKGTNCSTDPVNPCSACTETNCTAN